MKTDIENGHLTPSQRVWKARRARWAAHRATEARNRTHHVIGARRFNRATWEQALNAGPAAERRFLKSEGEGD